MPTNNIEIIVLTDKEDVAALRSIIPVTSPAIVPVIPVQNDLVIRYVNKDISALPLMVELLKGKDFKLTKKLLYAIKNIRYTTDWNFQITEPLLIETLFSLTKYKSLEWPLLDVLMTYRIEGYVEVLEKWFATTKSGILGSLLYHLTYIGKYDCLRMLEKKASARRSDQVAWPVLFVALMNTGYRFDKSAAAYLEAGIMQLFRRDTFSLKNANKESMLRNHINYLSLLCLYGTAEVTPLIDEFASFLQKDYLAYFRYRTGKTTNLTEILEALYQHKDLFTYRSIANGIGIPNMTEEWKAAILQHFLKNKTGEDEFENAWFLSRMFDWSGSPNFIKENISLIKDTTIANSLLKLHAIKTLPAETVLSDMLDTGLLKGVQKERAISEIYNGQRNAPHALPGSVMEQLSGKLAHSYNIAPVETGMQQHILRWAKDCGTFFNNLVVYAEVDEEKEYCGLVKAVFNDKGYIMKDPSGKGFQDFTPVRVLLNTILESEQAPERIVQISDDYPPCDLFGDVETLQKFAAKYDFRK